MRLQIYLVSLVATVLAAPSTAPGAHSSGNLTVQHHNATAGHERTRARSAEVWIIPISERSCISSPSFNPSEEWDIGWRLHQQIESIHIPPHDVRHWTIGTATWYICNCKADMVDTFPFSEYKQARDAIALKCGLGRAGWIYSKQWSKGYVVDHSRVVLLKSKKQLCHPGCVTNLENPEWEKNEADMNAGPEPEMPGGDGSEEDER